jgi:hypothetical protein
MAQHSRSKKKALRPPFLVTVITLAAVPACGGAVTGDTGGPDAINPPPPRPTTTTDGVGGATGVTASSSASSTSTGAGGASTGAGGASTAGAGGGTRADCPPYEPFHDSACATEGLHCRYPYCTSWPGPPLFSDLDCVGGKWQRQTTGTCNPPPPDGGVCPGAEPVVGAACLAGMRCSYGATCCGAPGAKKTYSCSGTWQFESYDPGSCGRDGSGLSPHTTVDAEPRPLDASRDADSSPCSDIVFPDVYVPPPDVTNPPPPRDATPESGD